MTKVQAQSAPSTRWVGAKIFGVGLLGGLLLLVLSWCYSHWWCHAIPAKTPVCKLIESSPPWTMLTTLVAAPSLWLTWYWRTTHKFEDIRIAEEGLVQKLEDIRIAQEQLATGRFVAALELLGKTESRQVVLGGIYALARIARDSPSEPEFAVVTELLSAFVRQQAPYDPRVDYDDDDQDDPPSSAIQAALTALGRLAHERPGIVSIDLRGTYLQRAIFRGNFDNAQFDGAQLWRADFSQATVNRARFNDATLQPSVNIDYDQAIGADFTGVWDRIDWSKVTNLHPSHPMLVVLKTFVSNAERSRDGR